LSYNGLYLCIQLFNRSIIGEYMVSELHAFGDILFGGISIFHFSLFVANEFIVGYLISLASSEDYSFISYFRIRIDSEEIEILFSFEQLDFTDCS